MSFMLPLLLLLLLVRSLATVVIVQQYYYYYICAPTHIYTHIDAFLQPLNVIIQVPRNNAHIWAHKRRRRKKIVFCNIQKCCNYRNKERHNFPFPFIFIFYSSSLASCFIVILSCFLSFVLFSYIMNEMNLYGKGFNIILTWKFNFFLHWNKFSKFKVWWWKVWSRMKFFL